MDDVKCKRMSRKKERNFTHKVLLSERTCNFDCYCSSAWMKNLHFFHRTHTRDGYVKYVSLWVFFLIVLKLCAAFLMLCKIFNIQQSWSCQIEIDTFQILSFSYMPAQYDIERFLILRNLHEKLRILQQKMLQILEILQSCKLYSEAACSKKFSRKTRHYNEFHVERRSSSISNKV